MRFELCKKIALFPETATMHTVVGERRLWLTGGVGLVLTPGGKGAL
ncbi:MAG TPA: hypothetical protein VFS00_19320 [Polyangiaceae bacterium]|nr:hypothetical protein [Polyangiaceae bacterium]